MLNEAYDLLQRLGVTGNYIGFLHAACAVSLCAAQPERLLLVTKWLYPEVAKQFGTNWKAVERNIRTVGDIIWRENRPLLEKLAHRKLERKPRNAQLLAILSTALNAGAPAASAVPEPLSDRKNAGNGAGDQFACLHHDQRCGGCVSCE